MKKSSNSLSPTEAMNPRPLYSELSSLTMILIMTVELYTEIFSNAFFFVAVTS